MMDRAEMLALRKRQLIAECAVQRVDLSCQLQALAHKLESVETGLRIVQRAGRHPEWIAAAALGLALITPRRLSSLLRLGTLGMRTWRTLAPSVRMLLARSHGAE